MAKKAIENGKPNRKRILVAPQAPSGPVNDRCIALRATWPRAAVMVKGIQSVAMENMCGDLVYRLKGAAPCRARFTRSTVRIACASARLSSLRKQGPITTGFDVRHDARPANR